MGKSVNCLAGILPLDLEGSPATHPFCMSVRFNPINTVV